MTLGARAATRELRRGALLASALVCGLLAGCPLELPRAYSCGDGWWDAEFEECDPRAPDSPHVDACRELGFAGDASCDPQTCTIRATEADCNTCGDGKAAEGEDCDGDDLRGQSCIGGTLACTSSCEFDYTNCPAYCGDGRISGNEECEPTALCTNNDDCDPDRACHDGTCVPLGENFLPNLACSAYSTSAVGFDKPYASGTIGACVKDGCYFGRNDCSFCGDGELDPEFTDLVAPSGTATVPAEFCDGDAIKHDTLVDHCVPLCVTDAFNDDVVVLCDFQCADDCRGFAGGDILPGQGPEDFGCCLDKGSPCPNFGIEGVPDYPCCSWFDNPQWLATKKCVPKDTGTVPVTFVCP